MSDSCRTHEPDENGHRHRWRFAGEPRQSCQPQNPRAGRLPRASPENIWERVKNQTHRPLLHDPDPQKKIRDLLAAREQFYKQADVLVNTDIRSAREVAQQVVHQFRLEAFSRQ